MPAISDLEALSGLDFGRLLEKPPEDDREEAFRPVQERALARVVLFKPITPRERREAFSRLGFHPHGIFLPDDWDLREKIQQALRVIGAIPDERVDERLSKYYEFQAWTQTLEGVIPGRWTGQMAVARSTARFRLVAWGRRGGKTIHAAHEALGVAIMRPRSWVWLAAPIMGLVDRGFEMVLRLIDDLGLETILRRNSTQSKVVILKNGAKIEGVSLENIMSAAGAAIDFAVVDEAAQIGPDAWERAIMPPLADRNGQALLISSYEGEGDFFHSKAMAAKAEYERYGNASDWEMFQGATYDVNFFVAPQGINTPSIIQARKEMDPQNFLEQFGAIPAGAKERVYPEFKEKVHVGNYPFNPDHPVILAVDPSGGSNPYAIVPVQDYGDRLYVVDEIYESHATFEELDPVIRTREWAANVTDVVMDSALPAEIERWVNAGWPAFAVFEKPRVEERLPLMRRWLRDPSRYYLFWRERINFFLRKEGRAENSDHEMRPEELRALMTYVEESLNNEQMVDEDVLRLRGCARIFFNRTCVNTIAEIKGYKYHRKRAFDVNFREEPIKHNDHCLIGSTLIFTSKGYIPIQAVRVEDRVWTRRGFKRVLWSGVTGYGADVVRVSFSNGRSLTGTNEHPLWVMEKGWTKILDVQVGDRVDCLASWSKLSPTEAGSIIATPNPLDDLIGSTIGGDGTTCIGTFGRTFTGIFRRGMLSIIRMATMTIRPKDWKHDRLTAITCRAIEDRPPQRSRTLIESAPSRPFGTGQTMGWSGTDNTDETPTQVDSRQTTSAPSAVALISPSICDQRTYFVRKPARPQHGEHRAWMTKIGPVWSAVRRFVSGNTSGPAAVPGRVVHIIARENVEGSFPVYDLTVEDAHEFYANGILVHNSMDALGYFLWHYKRFEITGEDEGSNFVRRVPPGMLPRYAPDEIIEGAPAQSPMSPESRRANWLGVLRDEYGPENPLASYSYLVRV